MFCEHPIPIKMPEDHFRQINFVENTFPTRTMYVPCNKCLPCKINRTMQTTIRLVLEHSNYNPDNCCFITLTYNDKNLPDNKSLVKRDLQLFMKGLRSEVAYDDKYSGKPIRRLRFYACGEYGEEDNTERPHYHICLFGLGPTTDTRRLVLSNWSKCDDYMIINNSKAVKPLGLEQMQYAAGYVQKKLYGGFADEVYEKTGRIPPFSLSSQRLGLSAFEKNMNQYVKDGYIFYDGQKVPIPRYFINKFNLQDKLPPQDFSNSPYRTFMKEHLHIPDDFDQRVLQASVDSQTDVYQRMIPNKFREAAAKKVAALNNLKKRGSL